MKTIKILAVALLATLATACSDDDKLTYNTESGAVVEMGEATVDVMENQGIFTLPVEVTGKRNGYITITVQCAETGAEGAVANRHYILTTDRINIADDATEASIELRTVDFRGENPTRTFTVTIVGAEGATVGNRKSTLVSIEDKGSSPSYRDLTKGKWFVSGQSVNFDTGEYSNEFLDEVSLRIGEQNAQGGGPVTITGVMGQFTMEMEYDYDPEEKYGVFVFNYGGTALTGTQYQEVVWTDSQNSKNGQPVTGKWNGTFTAVTFGDNDSRFNVSAYNPAYIGNFDSMRGFTLIHLLDE